jgi:hypothetical protein
MVLKSLVNCLELIRSIFSQLDPNMKHLELPSFSGKFIFGKTLDKQALNKAKGQVQNYLEVHYHFMQQQKYFCKNRIFNSLKFCIAKPAKKFNLKCVVNAV